MGEFWTRAISLVAVIVCLTGYNTVLDKREQAEEKLKEQQAELEQEQSGNAAEEATEVAYKDGTYTGEAQGFGGPVDVEVIIKNGKILVGLTITSAEKRRWCISFHGGRYHSEDHRSAECRCGYDQWCDIQFDRYQRGGNTGT
mgnify:CR=1 FL=1